MNRKPVPSVVSELAASHAVDVVILAECPVSRAGLLAALNAAPSRGFHLSTGVSKGITILTRFSREFLQPVFESDHVSMGRLTLPARSEVLLTAVHLPSKLFWSDESQSFECSELARRIIAGEDRIGHQRTVLVGDMNMNPFEAGVVSTVGLGAVPSRRIAERITRTVQGREYRLFYNPMWCHFGDAASDTAGSYYRDSAQHTNYFWHIFDQWPSGFARTSSVSSSPSESGHWYTRTGVPMLHFTRIISQSYLNWIFEKLSWQHTPIFGER